MEEQYFNEIRDQLGLKNQLVHPGKMMSSEAVQYDGKVFAFFSRKKKMVFKLGKAFDPDSAGIEINVFNPFKNRGPLNGWFEIPYSAKQHWIHFTEKALDLIKLES